MIHNCLESLIVGNLRNAVVCVEFEERVVERYLAWQRFFVDLFQLKIILQDKQIHKRYKKLDI
ncbi:hypothetical protein [uncultured Desulfuromonas sp.]|uniref:hypothetical protein n=1 Tax=uncultured Desulfuromonas sp. TaxID=181013 RepID=UPI002AAAF2F9|nr:hypothetical protein [uncultured Desulfuromonas sp.]